MKKNLEQLEHLNKLYYRLLNEVEVGIHVINTDGKTIFYNEEMAKMESMQREDVLDKRVSEVFTFHENQHSTLLNTLKTGDAKNNIRQTYFNNKGEAITTINDTFPIIKDGRITEAVEIAKDITQLEHVITENVLKKKNKHYSFEQLTGTSVNFLNVIDEAKRATRTTSSVLIVGETGTGKELFAQSIHNGSHRSSGPFIAQNCAAIPENLMESILFGTKKGAFTDATDTPGLFEQADGGTLLLDEINSLDANLQTKLLRVLQEKTIRPIGGTKDIEVDVRIIATMNEDPEEVIKNNIIRKDLFYRLSVVTLSIPALRARRLDILPLAQVFINKYNQLFSMSVKSMSDEVKTILNKHDWPGNVRELEHVIEGAMNLIIEEQEIKIEHLPARFRNKLTQMSLQKSQQQKEKVTMNHIKAEKKRFEKSYIESQLKQHDYNITHTAKTLGMSRQSLQYRIKKYSIDL